MSLWAQEEDDSEAKRKKDKARVGVLVCAFVVVKCVSASVCVRVGVLLGDADHDDDDDQKMALQLGSAWFQRKINLRPQHRGVHLVTEEILRQMPELSNFSVGLCHVQSNSIPILAIII